MIPIRWDEVVYEEGGVSVEYRPQFRTFLHTHFIRPAYMLIGEYRHTIDDKNRLSLPAKFRKEMGKTVVVTPGLDSCLFVFTAKSWERLSASLSDSSVLSADRRQLNRYLLGGATEVPVDGAGRMLLSEHLREWGKLQSKVVVIGVRDRVEIWDESLWQTYRDNAAKNAEAVAEKLSSVGMI